MSAPVQSTAANDTPIPAPTTSPEAPNAAPVTNTAVPQSGDAQRVHRVKNPTHLRSGLKSYARVMRKYNMTPTCAGPFQWIEDTEGPVDVLVHKMKDMFHNGFHHSQNIHRTTQRKIVQNGDEVKAADIQNDSEYVAPVSIGCPPQTMLLQFDSGSSDLWFQSTHLSSAVQKDCKANHHNIFDSSKSTSWKPSTSNETWKIQYGDGSGASGMVGRDVCRIGKITINNQACELATEMSTEFSNDAEDGLLGLAFPNINTVQPSPVATPVQNMQTQGDIPKDCQLFTFYAGSWRDKDDPDHGQSFFTFGELDQGAVNACGGPDQIHYTPVDSSQGF